MKRINLIKTLFGFVAMINILTVSPVLPVAHAEAVFAPSAVPVASTGMTEEEAERGFPSSRFGAPPAAPELGFNSPQAYVEMNTGPVRGLASVSTPPISDSTSGVKDSGPASTQSFGQPMIPKPIQGIQEIALIVSDSGFYPKTLFVTRDIPVRLFVTGASKKSLCVMMDSFQIRRQVKFQKIEEIQFTPKTAGTVRFYCPINGMEGILYVKNYGTLSSPAEEK